MGTYKGIQGYSVQKLSSDPSPTANYVGQLWYNSGTGKFKIAVEGTGAWASGGNINTTRWEDRGGGTQTAGIVIGGRAPGFTGATETYNGATWTEVTAMGTARSKGGCGSAGTSTSNIYFSGEPGPSSKTETWNGTSWTEVADIGITVGGANIGTGTQTAALCCGGHTGAASTVVASWNGTSWSPSPAMNTGRYQLGGCGTSTASIVFGSEPAIDTTETFNGTSWTAVNSLNNARNMAAGAGTTTSAICAGNYPTPVGTQAENWNGTSWTTVSSLATGRWSIGAGGTGTLAFYAGGNTPPGTSVTEEWTSPNYDIQTVTVS